MHAPFACTPPHHTPPPPYITGKMQDKLIIGAAVSFTLCLLIERACRSLFPVLTHPVIVERRRQIELEGGAGETRGGG